MSVYNTYYLATRSNSMKMWWPTVILLLFVTLEHSTASASLVVVQSNRCDITGNSGDGQFLAPDPLLGDWSRLPSENCIANLTSALQDITSHTTILLETGNYSIDEFILVHGVTNITLKAEFKVVSIQCVKNTGLAFINVSQLSLLNIVIDGCGFTGTDIENTVDILKDTVNIFYAIPKVVRIAMLLGHSENVTMENVTIMSTRGFGLVGINVIGSSRLNGVLFFNNSHPGTCVPPYRMELFPRKFIDFDSRNRLGGAAVFMYFDYHHPMLLDYRGSQFNLSLQNCNFIMNSCCSNAFLNLFRLPGRGETRLLTNTGYRLGGSGAFTLTLAQLQYGMDIAVNESTFDTNFGARGGGALISMFTGVRKTHVMFDDCCFERSAVVFFNDVRLPQSMEYPPYPPNRDTVISFLDSSFTNNRAQGLNSTLVMYSSYYSGVSSINEVVKVYIDKCIFKENQAFVGSAIIIYEYKSNGLGVGMQVSIKDTDFINNEIITADQDATITISQSAGTVDIRNINLTLHGSCSFISNTGTGIRAESSLIGVNGNITFQRNIGINGGALHLVSYSYLIMNRNSSIYFIDNEARIEGGAIYVNENGLNSHIIGGFVDCFIHFAYDNFLTCENCSDLNSFNVYIQFSGNRAPNTGMMVSGSSLSTCPWAYGVINKSRNPDQSLFEILNEEYSSVFSFDEVPDNPILVRSAAASLEIEHLDSFVNESNITKVFPGQTFSVNISAIDDFSNIVSNVVAAFASSDTLKESDDNGTNITPFLSSNRFAVLDENNPTTVPVRLIGRENQNVSLIIYSTDIAGRAQEQINILLYPCGFGFQFDTTERICVCDSRLEQHGIACNNSQQMIVPDGIWIGPFMNQREIVVHRCIYGYCKPGEKNITIHSPDNGSVDFDVQCNPQMNRAGFLCGSCRAGYSAVLGSRKCKPCSHLYISLLPVFLAIGIVAIILITHLNVTITAGFINGAIFYSNIVSIYDSILIPGGTLTNQAIALVSFPTLNLGFETCLYNYMSTLEKVWWQLSFPLYLFVLIGLTTWLVRKKCLKFKQSTGFSTIQAFATLLILCYVSVLEACIELIAFRRIYTIEDSYHIQWLSDPSFGYFGVKHGALGFLAYLIIFLYLFPLPILLLFPSALYKSRYFSKFKPIYDAFWDPYKPRFRFYLGFRLIVRWIPFTLAIAVRPPFNVFGTNFLLVLLLAFQITTQPFRDKWVNYIDNIFVLNLVLLFSGSVYFWSEYGLEQLNRDDITEYAVNYSNVFIFLGFLIMLGIFVYHVIVRFPRLQELIGHCSKKTLNLLVKIYNFRETKDTINATSVATEQGNQALQQIQLPETKPAVICATVLREPLLESGTVELYSVSPSSVPTRMQTMYVVQK